MHCAAMRNSLVLSLSLEHWSRGERGAYEGIHAIIMPKTALTSGQRTNEGQRVGRKHSECKGSTFFGHPGELRGLHFVLNEAFMV